MTYAEFVNLVERLWDEIPEAFKKGLQGVHVLPKAKPEPGLKGVWRRSCKDLCVRARV
jgi:hypothetical protein